MSLKSNINITAQKIQSALSTFEQWHIGIDRIGRMFRDVWAAELQTLDPEIEFRNSGRTVAQWSSMGTAFYTLHRVIESDHVPLPGTDPTQYSYDAVVESGRWIEGENSSEEAFNVLAYNSCMIWNELVYVFQNCTGIYEVKAKEYIESLADLDTQDEFTGRTKKAWMDVVSAMNELVNVSKNRLATTSECQLCKLLAF